jgi:hypothetical protein
MNATTSTKMLIPTIFQQGVIPNTFAWQTLPSSKKLLINAANQHIQFMLPPILKDLA